MLTCAIEAQAKVLVISEAHAKLAPVGQPAVQGTVTLPHRWDHAFPGRDGHIEYLVTLQAITSRVNHGVYFPRVGNQVEIYLDSQLVVKLGSMGNHSTDAAKSPLWVPLPATLLSAEHVTPLRVVVDVQAGRWGGLAAPYFGPEAEVFPIYRERYVWRQWGAIAVVFCLMLMSVLAGSLWILQRDPVYGFFSLSAAFGMVRFADRIMDHPPLPWPLWGAVAAAALSAHILLMTRFALAVIDRNDPYVRRTFWTILVFQVGAAALAFLANISWLWTLALVLLALPACIALGLVVRVACRERSRETIALSVASLVCICAGIRDFFAVRVSGDGSGTFSILPIATMLFVAFMGWIIADRYVRHARAHASLLLSLDEKIKLREDELASTYAKLRSEQANQGALEERQRIMRDIHDGVGAHLVGLISMLRKGTSGPEVLQEHASAALDELRMAVDSMQPVNGDIATVLATLRYRLQPRLEAAGIEMDWQVGDLPSRDDLTPQVVLQIQRIFLEAFTNVLKHAHATRISVIAKVEKLPTARLMIDLIDNGTGFPELEGETAGHGLKSMKARAQTIGADFQISRLSTGGTRVLLSLPSV